MNILVIETGPANRLIKLLGVAILAGGYFSINAYFSLLY